MTHPILHIVNFMECEVLDVHKIKRWFMESAEIAKAKVLHKAFHVFPNGAITGVLILSESHMAIHTWPEYKNCQIDIFSCGEKMQPMAAISYLEYRLKPKTFRYVPFERPVDETTANPVTV